MNDRNAQYDPETGKPLDQSYLECGLPEDLHESILRMEESWNIIDSGRQDNHWDLCWCDLNALINSYEVEQVISSEQAWYLRRKISPYGKGVSTMLDFTALPTRNKFYAGANGAKIAVIYDGEQYMLKFPAPAPKNKELSYANSCISEYIGCHIFNSVGIAAQETLLGIYRKKRCGKIVVACKDFTSPGIVLQDFASLKNTVINSGHSGYGTELSDITQAMEDQTAFPPALLKQHFWDMFIVDALIGNWDRHNGNWGFLYNTMTDELHLAPVYDCGSSLLPTG